MKYLLIAGGRDFNDYDYLQKCLQKYENEEISVVSGTAKGADSLGEQWAKEHHFPVIRFKPDWDHLGKKAGILRNVDMLNFIKSKDSETIVFWDGVSHGSAHMASISEKAGIKTTIFSYS